MNMTMQESFLLNIPTPIVAAICSEWLKIQDVSKLDSAWCQHDTRALFLGIISGVTFRAFCTFQDHFHPFMWWVVLRHLRIDSLAIPAKAFPWNGEMMVNFLKSIGHQLETLDISYLPVDCTFFFSDISYYCKNLIELNVHECVASCGAVRSVLMHCPHLAILGINNAETFPSHGFDGLCLPNLHSLRLQSCDQSICAVLAKATPNLRKFRTNGIFHLNAAGIQLLCEGCPALHEVRFPRSFKYQNFYLAAECVAALFMYCKDLNALDLARQMYLKDASLASAAFSLTNLRKLCIHFMFGLTDLILIHIAKNCSQLQLLGCDGCYFSDVGLAVIAGGFPELHTLYIGNHTHSTMTGYLGALKNLPALVKLGLFEVDAGDALLEQIGAVLPLLRHVELQYCMNYTLNGLVSVARQLKSFVMTAQDVTDPFVAALSRRYPRLDVFPATQRGFTCAF